MKNDNKLEWLDPEIKVTKINKRWHARLILKGKVINEMACEYSEDIGWICREMLRQYDKLGGMSIFALKARNRQKTQNKGKVWYKITLDTEKAKRKKAKND